MTTTLATTKWAVDPMHSEILFKVKHLVISTVTGSFKNFSGTAITDGENFDNAAIEFSMDVNSIDTRQESRDAHLKSPDFFDAELFPDIKFTSTSFTKVDDDQYKMVGDLTMKGVTKPVALNVEYGGTQNDLYGTKKVGFEITGKINRKEFGLTYNALTETGGLALGEDIKLIANIQVAQLS